jgi:hypothetical protein
MNDHNKSSQNNITNSLNLGFVEEEEHKNTRNDNNMFSFYADELGESFVDNNNSRLNIVQNGKIIKYKYLYI